VCFTRLFIGFEKDVHEHVNVYVNVGENRNGEYWLRSGPFEGPATAKPTALPEDT